MAENRQTNKDTEVGRCRRGTRSHLSLRRCEISLLAVCFQWQSDGTALYYKVPVAPTHRGGRIAYRKKKKGKKNSAYSPESGFPEAPLRAGSPVSTGPEPIEDLQDPEPGERRHATRPSVLLFYFGGFNDFEERCVGSGEPRHGCSFGVVGAAGLRGRLSSRCVYPSPLDAKRRGLIYELAHRVPHHFKEEENKHTHC